MLSDGHLYKSSPTSNTRLEWSFGGAYYSYSLYLFSLFEVFIGTPPKQINTRSASGDKEYPSIRLKTLSLPLFNSLHTLFYTWIPELGTWVKRVPSNIADLMNPIVLAFLIMSDGNYDAGRNRVRIYTNSFTYEDTLSLSNAIRDKLGINCSVLHDRKGQYIITIGALEIPKLQELVREYFHPSLLYRINLPNIT